MFTAIFLGCLAVTAAITVIGIVSDSTGADMPGYNQPDPPPVVTIPPAIADPVVMSKEKKNLTPNGESIIGLKDPSLTINATGTLDSFTDYLEYGDRAIVKLTNNTTGTVTLTGLCIKGKPVMQLAGQNGYVWEYSDYDSIEKEGEQFVEVSNDFIFDPVQAKQIGDFVWKELKPHKLYSLMLVGCQYQYEIGDVYHLTLEHTMNGGTMENIDTDVEVMGVSINRSVGGVGMTNLNLRVPSEAWALTLAKNSKLVGAGNAQRLNNRSNVVTVAASTWTGQADYFCDGTDDNVEIQAAIDYIASLGGGEVELTSGIFYISSTIDVKSEIKIVGSGYGSIVSPSSNSLYKIISASGKSSIFDIVIDGNNIQYYNEYVDPIIDGDNLLSLVSVELRNYIINRTSVAEAYDTESILIKDIYFMSNCNVHSVTGINTNATRNFLLRCVYNVASISGCNIYSVSGTGLYYGYHFAICYNISSCRSYNNSAYFNAGFIGCRSISSCSVQGNTGTRCYGFTQCNNLSVCVSLSNTGTTDEVGFNISKALQQCRSDDTTKYATSYADYSGTQLCADTAAGGYNS